jgi:hypothetical protein
MGVFGLALTSTCWLDFSWVFLACLSGNSSVHPLNWQVAIELCILSKWILILWSCKLLVTPSTWDTFTVLMDFPTMSVQTGYLNFKVTENEMQISFTVYCSDRNPWKQRTAYVIANHTNVNILLQPFELHSSIALPSYKMPRILAVNYAVWECLLCVYLNMQIGFRIIGPCMLCCCLLSHWNVPEWNCWIILMHCGWITAAR